MLDTNLTLDSLNEYHQSLSKQEKETITTLHQHVFNGSDLNNTNAASFVTHDIISSIVEYSAEVAVIVKSVADTGESVADLVDPQTGEHHHSHLSHQFHTVGFIVSIFNFLRYPFEYAYGWMTGKPVKNTLSKNASWFQAGVMLVLAITSTLFPAFAVALGFAATFIGLGGAALSLANVYMERYRLQDVIDDTQEKIKKIELLEGVFKEKAIEKYQELNQALESKDQTKISALLVDIKRFNTALENNKASLEALKQDKSNAELELSQNGQMAVIDRSFGIAASCVAIVGLTFLFINPPVALVILAAVTVTAFVYTAGRVLTPIFKGLYRWSSSKLNQESVELAEKEVNPDMAPDDLNGYSNNKDKFDDNSTKEIMQDLSANKTRPISTVIQSSNTLPPHSEATVKDVQQEGENVSEDEVQDLGSLQL
jgi:hypothetical protein